MNLIEEIENERYLESKRLYSRLQEIKKAGDLETYQIFVEFLEDFENRDNAGKRQIFRVLFSCYLEDNNRFI